jgi:hypothetical protein
LPKNNFLEVPINSAKTLLNKMYFLNFAFFNSVNGNGFKRIGPEAGYTLMIDDSIALYNTFRHFAMQFLYSNIPP